MNADINRICSNGWFRSASLALFAIVINDVLIAFVGSNRAQMGTYTLAAFVCLFIWTLIIAAAPGERGGYLMAAVITAALVPASIHIANSFVPVISMHHKGRPSIDGQCTVPNALPLLRTIPSDNMIETTIQLENIGKETLSNAMARISIPGMMNLTCVNRTCNPVAGDPLDGRWHNTVDVDLGSMHPKRPPIDLILHVEFQQGGWQQDLELTATVYGDEYPEKGKPTAGEKLCIQRP